jgi:hypothetical protein
MRPDRTETDPGRDTRQTDGWNRADTADIVERGDRGDGRAELPQRASRAGSPVDVGTTAGSWQEIKSQFVDDPAAAIAAAEGLVHQAVEDRIRALKDEAAALCAQERDEADAASSTETLRTRLIRYQAFWERLTGTAVH